MTDESPKIPPKIFISYSWTSDEHTEWVGDLGERLMNDGIEVVLDQWSLEDGHDVHAFMEQMVSDSTIKRVIIVSDALYAAKADGREGGVGTETQIISREVYDSVEQTKFVALLRERDEEGKACLPVFLKSRKYIDFSDSDAEAEAYDQLIRNIFERPRRRKPAIGKAPSHLFDDKATIVTSAQKAKRFREIVTTGKGNPSAAFDDFVQEFLLNFEELRLAFDDEKEESWCQTMYDNIEQARVHRNIAVDVLRTGIMHIREQWFMDDLVRFLERILPFQNRPSKTGSFFEYSEDNYKLLIYEMFLYTIAAFISARRFTDARFLFDYSYVAPETRNGEKLQSYSFSQFNEHASSLEGMCADRGDTRRLSVMADLIHDRADRTDIRFSELLQADVICCLAASRNERFCGWYPRTLVYSGRLGVIELFARATTATGFAPLKELVGFDAPQELLQYIQSNEMTEIWHDRDMFRSVYIEELFNLDNLNHIWLGKS